MLLALFLLFCSPPCQSESEWKEHLPKERYSVMRKKETERSFSGKHLHEMREGLYVCGACQFPLFRSSAKYRTPSGWASFTGPIDKENLEYEKDSFTMVSRYQVFCSCCKGYLGHVFQDGPPPKYFRYCIQSISLDFYPGKKI